MVYGFDRLIKKMDDIAGTMSEEVIIQIGNTTYEPKNAKYFRFAPRDHVNKLYASARIIVCHSGVGSIITALEYCRSIIVVPRLKIYGEHIDDHQIEIAKELEMRGIVTVVYNTEDLKKVIDTISGASFVINRNGELVVTLKNYLNAIVKE